MVREILVPTDFSAPAESAARVAREYAQQFEARVHLLHVVWPSTDPTPWPALDRLAAELGRGVRVVTAIESGFPLAGEILRYAERSGIDLIVMGTHGRTGVSRALIGSVAERVVRTAPCPVLTVPAEWTDRGPERPAVREPALRRCLVCAASSEDLICEPCRARIRGEVLERKQREERAGRS